MAFTGTLLRRLTSQFDEAALDQSVDEHTKVIEYYLDDIGTKIFINLDHVSFERDILDTVMHYLATDFNIDVFASIWEAEFAKLNPDFHAEILVTQQHLKAESADKAAAKKAELAGISVEELQWETKSMKRSDRKAKQKLKQVAARAQDAADELVSSDDEERDHSVEVNSVVITPRSSRKRAFDEPDSILAGHKTPAASAANNPPSKALGGGYSFIR
jgi:hypothetical protein